MELESQAGTLTRGDSPAIQGQPGESTSTQSRRRSLPARVSRDRAYRASLVLADALAAGLAIRSAQLLRPGTHSALVLLSAVPLMVIVSKVFGAYDRDDLAFGHSTLDEAPALFQLATTYSLLVWVGYGALVAPDRGLDQLLALWLVLVALVMAFRVIARACFRAVGPPERCLLVGDDPNCDWLETKLTRGLGGHVIVAGRTMPRDFSLAKLAVGPRIDRVIVAPGRNDGGVGDLVRSCRTEGVKVSIVPLVLEAVGCSSVKLDDVEGITLLSMAPAGFSDVSRLTKRAMDVVGASLLLLLFAPFAAVIAVAIKLDSSGDVFFRQRRVGRGGEVFHMCKFRTMTSDAEAQKRQLDHLNEARGLFKIANDPRITRVGRVLRRTSLDEVPQLFNVLRGEMSLVGPRPLVLEEDEQIEGWHRRRLQLTPGMTGHWQILGSARIPLEDMVRIDYLYVTNWSLWLDIKILLRTLPYVLARRGM